jgi:hypothetical protein
MRKLLLSLALLIPLSVPPFYPSPAPRPAPCEWSSTPIGPFWRIGFSEFYLAYLSVQTRGGRLIQVVAESGDTRVVLYAEKP